jgi:D-beta-D-heptose 7-phosphate kinase / D-beta-D-heptose 1-phosphate adenosyltransferase
MKKLISKLKSGFPRDVLVVGDLMLDEYISGTANRISPEAPVLIVKQEKKEWYLGGAANVAANCKHVGFNTNLVGIVGSNDFAGRKFVSILRDMNVSCDGVIRSKNRVTTCKRRIMVENYQCLRVDSEDVIPLSKIERESINSLIDKFIIEKSIVLISDYGKGVVDKELIDYIIFRARQVGILVLVDPKGPDFSKYKGVDFIKPNLSEFNKIVNFFNLPKNSSIEENGKRICSLLDLSGLIVTLGGDGIHFVSEKKCIKSNAFKREVYDLSGAGDTVAAFLALSFVNDLDVKEALMLANNAASIAVSHMKTYAVSLNELIDNEIEPSEKIVCDWARLKIELDWQRVDGKRVVFTNGCFDLIHSGHIHLLKEAKKLGSILVVALNSDHSVRQQGKGKDRPVNPFFERASILAAIGFVDFVTCFEEVFPEAIIKYLQPDVLVKGGDYKKENIIGYDFVTSRGGEVHVIDLVPGKSTTHIVKKISFGA